MLVSYLLLYDFDMETRPKFEEIKNFEEFSKYYWYREELVKICRQLGICSSGYKADLNKRIEEYFRGVVSQFEEKQRKVRTKKELSTVTLETGLIECGFRFSQKFRDFFSAQTGIKNFKFNADMVATARKVRETEDESFTLGDLLEIYYGRKSYAHYDKVSLQWNKFVKDFCADPASAQFPNKLKTAACLWKQVRESTREKVYKHELLEELNQLHTTPMGVDRIRRNLELGKEIDDIDCA